MAYLDYFGGEDERRPPGEAPGGSSAPAGPVSMASPPQGSPSGAPDRPGATALPMPGGNPAQNGTGFVSIDRYFAPNAEVAAGQTANFLGSQTGPTTTTTQGPAPTPPSFADWATENPIDLGGAKGGDVVGPAIQRAAYDNYTRGLKPESTTITTPGTLDAVQSPGGVIGELQKQGGPNYTEGMAGLDAYLMGRSGLEGGLGRLRDYFSPDPPVRHDPPIPRKPIYDPAIDDPMRDRYGGGY